MLLRHLLTHLLTLPLNTPAPSEHQDFDSQVQRILDEHFSGAREDRRKDYARRIIGCLKQCKSRQRVQELLEAMPRLAEYYGTSVEDYRRMLPDPDGQEDLILRGYDIFADQMAIVVGRSAQREISEQTKLALIQQIDAIFDHARKVLGQKLLGAPAGNFLDREIAGLRGAWINGIETPFNGVFDTPLSAGALAHVLQEMRHAADPFTPVLLAEEDVLSETRLRQLGVERLISAVREKAYLVTQICYQDRAESVTRERQWVSEVKAVMRAYAEQRARSESEKSRAPSPHVKSESTARAVPPVAESDRTVTEEEGHGRTVEEPAASRTGPQPRSRVIGVAVLLGLLVVASLAVGKALRPGHGLLGKPGSPGGPFPKE